MFDTILKARRRNWGKTHKIYCVPIKDLIIPSDTIKKIRFSLITKTQAINSISFSLFVFVCDMLQPQCMHTKKHTNDTRSSVNTRIPEAYWMHRQKRRIEAWSSIKISNAIETPETSSPTNREARLAEIAETIPFSSSAMSTRKTIYNKRPKTPNMARPVSIELLFQAKHKQVIYNNSFTWPISHLKLNWISPQNGCRFFYAASSVVFVRLIQFDWQLFFCMFGTRECVRTHFIRSLLLKLPLLLVCAVNCRCCCCQPHIVHLFKCKMNKISNFYS